MLLCLLLVENFFPFLLIPFKLNRNASKLKEAKERLNIAKEEGIDLTTLAKQLKDIEKDMIQIINEEQELLKKEKVPTPTIGYPTTFSMISPVSIL